MKVNPTYTLLIVSRVLVHESQPNLHLTNCPQSLVHESQPSLCHTIFWESWISLQQKKKKKKKKERGRKKLFYFILYTHISVLFRGGKLVETSSVRTTGTEFYGAEICLVFHHL